MADYWKDAFIDPPAEEAAYWIRSNSGCLAPVHAYFSAGSSTWTLDLITVEYLQVPIWEYRMYKPAL